MAACCTAGESLIKRMLCSRDMTGVLISTDPPYYDNIGYSDLSDFFYVWLRRTLRVRLPETSFDDARAEG